MRRQGTGGTVENKNAYRNISIGADAVGILREKKKEDGGRSEYVFPSLMGGPMSPDGVPKIPHGRATGTEIS